MKTVLALFVLIALVGVAEAQDQQVKGHYRDTNGDGVKDTYIQPYQRTAPDNTIDNNYSTKGNTNPYTGEQGSVTPQPYHVDPPSNNQYKSFYPPTNRR